MVVKRAVPLSLVVAACIMLSGPVMAQDAAASADTSANAGTATTVPMVSGGVGDDEMSYLKGVEHEYNLKVLFTEPSGVFLSDLPVNIIDRHGETVVTTVTKGPILLVKLPAGSYTVSATDGGVSKQEKVSVSGHSLHTLQFRFPGNDQKLDN